MCAAHKGVPSAFKGRHHTEETRQILRNQHIGMKHSEESKQKMSLVRKGRKHSEEHRKRISEALSGRKKSAEHCKAISESAKGRVYSEERKQYFSKLFSGEGNPFFGKRHKPEVVQQIIQRNYERTYTGKETYIETTMKKALSERGIAYETEKRLYGRPDLFIAPNICIFCDGDYYHANPAFYGSEQLVIRGQLAKDLWEKDKRITVTLELMGYKVLRFWEYEIRHNLQGCIDSILKVDS